MFAHLNKFISGEIQSGKAQGISIALIVDQRMLWSKGFGFESRHPDHFEIPVLRERGRDFFFIPL